MTDLKLKNSVVFFIFIFFLKLGNNNLFCQTADTTKKDSVTAPVTPAPAPIIADTIPKTPPPASDTTNKTSSVAPAIQPPASLTADSIEKFFADTTKSTKPTPTTKSNLPQPHSVVSMEFVKEKEEQSADSTFFNILKITNTNAHPIEGIVKISVPVGWTIISEDKRILKILPNQTEYIPIRISLSRTVTGGTSYIINATLTANRSLFPDKNQNTLSKACYITVPQKSKWDVYAVQRTIYFDRYTEYTPLQLKMVNKGNGAEVVKLGFEIGSSLQMYGALGNRHFTSIELKPHSDTILSFPIKYLPADESDLWNRDFRKLTVKVTATVDTIVKQTSVNYKYLESTYYNLLSGKVTPLNIELQLQNLLSDVPPRMLLAAYGTVLLKNDDVIDYNVRFNNIPFSGYGNAADAADYLWRRSRMMASYKSAQWEARIGDNLGYGSGFFGVIGRGVGGKYNINSKNAVGGAFGIAIGTPIYSGTVFHETMLPKAITLRSSLNAIVDDYNKLNTYGAAFQVNYPFLPGHSISLLLSPSLTQHNYNNQTFLDGNGNYIITNNPGVTLFGFASQLDYRMHLKKFSGTLNAQMATKNFSQYYSGKMNINANARYIINQKYFLVGNSGLFLQDPRMYNRGILYPEHKYFSGTHRVELGDRMTNKLTLFAGPMVEHLSYSSLKIDRFNGDSTYTHFNTISPKLSVRCSYKNNVSGFINPYAMIGYTFITSAEDSSINPPTPFLPKDAFFNVKAGLNIIQSNWGVNVYYYLGPQNLSSQMDYYYFGRYSKSLRIMPFFQKYYFNKKMLLSSYDSYYYEVLSNNERIALNARLQFFFEHEWTFYVDNNLYLSSVISSDGQKVYGRNYFLSLGLKKSFDIPQPRIKYYDLKVICFKDINGNKTQDVNEQGLSDIVIKVDREAKTDSVTKKSIRQPGQFSPAEMVSDNFGQVIYYHIPEGEFNLHVYPLANLKDLYNINGQTQKITISRDTTYYIPFVQSFRVIGRIILNRDEFSSNGIISTANIRITATDSAGNSFPTLTANDGSYTLYVPQAGEYKVSINNVFGDQFLLQEPEYTVIFNGAKEFQVDFIFNERKRQVNVNGTTTSVDTLLGRKPFPYLVVGFDTLRNITMVPDTMGSSKSDTSAEAKKHPERHYLIPVGEGITYKVQLVATSNRIPKAQYKTKFPGVTNVAEYVEGGTYKYTTGDFKTVEEAKKSKADLRTKGYLDAFLVPFHKGNRVKY